MGLIWEKPAEWETCQSIEESVEKGYAFYFRGDNIYFMTTHCHMCKKLRFTPEEVKILSNENLTKEEFDEKFGWKQAYNCICNDDSCVIKLWKKLGGLNAYQFEHIWDHIERMKVADEQEKIKQQSETDEQNQSVPN